LLFALSPPPARNFAGEWNDFQDLVEQGEDINAAGASQRTPLHRAVGCSKEDGEKIVKLLLDKGANVEAQDNNGFTPM
jgi:ankyrin repeat protein